MHLSHAFVIATDKAKQNFSIYPAGIFIDAPHYAKIIGNHIAIGGDLDITLMQIRMEKAIPKSMR